MLSRRQFLAATALPAGLSLGAAAQAQQNVVRLVVGFSAGGAADFVARQLAQHLQAELGSTVVVDNRPGAGGRIAVDVVKNAAPDGRTLLVTPGSILTIYPHVYDKLSYQPLRDLVPVSNLCAVPYSINIGPAVPANITTLQQFGQWLRAHPRQASYGSPGAGTTPHFLGAMYAASIGIDYLHVPYKGGSLALQDVMGGQLTSSCNVVSEAVPHAQSPKLRILAVSSPQRIPQLPKVPTLAELGMQHMTSQEWVGLLAPKGTKPEVIERLHIAANRCFDLNVVQKALGEMAFGVTTGSQEEFAQLLKADLEKWGPVVRSTGFKAEA